MAKLTIDKVKEMIPIYIVSFFILDLIILIPLFIIFPSPEGPPDVLVSFAVIIIFIVPLLIAIYRIYYGEPKEQAKAIEEFDPCLVPSIGKTFIGEVEGWFTFSGTTEDGKFYAASSRSKAKSATITFHGDHVSVEGIITTSGTIESHDYIVFSSSKTLSYEGVGTLSIGPDPHRPIRIGRKITYMQPSSELVNITCNTEEDAISLYNGLMDIWIKGRSE